MTTTTNRPMVDLSVNDLITYFTTDDLRAAYRGAVAALAMVEGNEEVTARIEAFLNRLVLAGRLSKV